MKNIFKIYQLSKPLHRFMLAMALAILLGAILQLALPVTIKLIVDQIEQQVTTGTGNLQSLQYLIITAFIINICYISLESASQRLGDFIASRLATFLTEKFYRKIFTLPQKYFDSEISGKIVNQLTRGITSVKDFTSAATNFIAPAILQSFFTIFVLAYYSPLIAALALSIFPIYITISQYSTKQWGKREVEKNKHEDTARGRIQEAIANIKLVKSFNTQFHEWKFVKQQYGFINAIYDKQSNTYHIYNFARNFGLEVIMIVIMIISFNNTFQGIFSLGEMVLILQLLGQLRRPLFAMSFILERIRSAEAGSQEYFQILELESTETILSKSKLKKFTNTNLQFNNVSFSYEQGDTVLSDVNFKLKSNESIALVGHSGAGKSTIINLILKFYDPTSGQILISNKDYAHLDHQVIRHNISLVFQDNELFSSTIRENVAYGVLNPKEEDIVKALKQANAYDFVMKLPKGLDAKVGERGVKLSGGQKQRIQIARAIMHDAPILILDEATSSLDSKSEKLVQDALEKLFKNRLVIIIAHRFSTIQNVDRVMVVENGTITASGASKDLAKKPGVYSELLRYQIQGNKKLLEQYEIY